uniref:Uncharacterized protein n=1 Tax=Oryza nivara TaxID=4536 RepID=A0A0E0FQF2_ORYNI
MGRGSLDEKPLLPGATSNDDQREEKVAFAKAQLSELPMPLPHRRNATTATTLQSTAKNGD